jgi:hypothetical protein
VQEKGGTGLSRRALIALVGLLVLAGVAFPLAHALSSGKAEATTRMRLERAAGPTGASELIAYVRTKGGDPPLATGDVLRLRCTSADGRLTLRAARPLSDDRGIYVPHVHIAVAPELLDGIRACHGSGGGLTLTATLPSPLR